MTVLIVTYVTYSQQSNNTSHILKLPIGYTYFKTVFCRCPGWKVWKGFRRCCIVCYMV